jgi:pyrimidine 5'-nucleotidase
LSLFPNRKIIFTNANQDHAERVLDILGIDEFFSEIIDILQISPYCKPMPEAYQKALEISGLSNPADCVVIDDSPRNLKTARELGFFTIQVGTDTRCSYADAAILTIADLPDIIPAGMETQREE